jgi:hypothetical protein
METVMLSTIVSYEDLADEISRHASNEDAAQFVRFLDDAMQDWEFTEIMYKYFASCMAVKES